MADVNSKAYEREYAADMKLFALDDAAAELAHGLFAHECFAYTGEGRDHSDRCKAAARKIRQFGRIWAGYGTE